MYNGVQTGDMPMYPVITLKVFTVITISTYYVSQDMDPYIVLESVLLVNLFWSNVETYSIFNF